MLPKNKANTVQEYATESGYKVAPTQDQITKGVVPLDTLPAQWWNWLWNQMTTQHNLSVTTVTSILRELQHVLTLANIEPDAATETQLAEAIKKLTSDVIGNVSDIEFATDESNTIVGALNSLYDTLVSDNNSLEERLNSVESLIPAQATSENQLADKAFVTNEVSTNTANFAGTFNSVEDLNDYTGPLTNNDYAYVKTTDSTGNIIYDRYKYKQSEGKWKFEYTLNTTGFTAAQMAAIDSGMTEEKVSQIHDMVGATASTDGESGFVPKPLAGQQDMILRGDGRWIKMTTGGGSSSSSRFQGIWENWTSVPNTDEAYPKGTPEEGDEIYIQDMSDYTGKVSMDLTVEDFGTEKPEDPGDAPWWPEGDYTYAIILLLMYFEKAQLSASQEAAYVIVNVTELSDAVTVQPLSTSPLSPTIIQGLPYAEENQYEYLLIFTKSVDTVVHGNFNGFIEGSESLDEGATYKLRYRGTWDEEGKYGWAIEYSMLQLVPVMTGTKNESGSWQNGKLGLVPAPLYYQHDYFLKATGEWVPISPMRGATSSQAGASGLVPVPAQGEQDNFLRGDGKWAPISSNHIQVTFSIEQYIPYWEQLSTTQSQPSEGQDVWLGPDNYYYYSDGDTQYYYSARWRAYTWSGLKPNKGRYVWRDSDNNIYYSDNTTQLQLVNGTWVTKDWGTLIPYHGNCIWQDKDGTYHCDDDDSYTPTNCRHIKLVDGQWVSSGDNTVANGHDVWHDAYGNIYYSYDYTGSSSVTTRNYIRVINQSNQLVWKSITFRTDVGHGRYIYNDRNGNAFFSRGSSHYYFDNNRTWVPLLFSTDIDYIGYNVYMGTRCTNSTGNFRLGNTTLFTIQTSKGYSIISSYIIKTNSGLISKGSSIYAFIGSSAICQVTIDSPSYGTGSIVLMAFSDSPAVSGTLIPYKT